MHAYLKAMGIRLWIPRAAFDGQPPPLAAGENQDAAGGEDLKASPPPTLSRPERAASPPAGKSASGLAAAKAMLSSTPEKPLVNPSCSPDEAQRNPGESHEYCRTSPEPQSPVPAGNFSSPEKPQSSPAPPSVPTVISDPPSADWQLLRDQVTACQRCLLHQTRTRTVFGVGNENADLMFVGEGPGEQEDLQGEPFVGRAGQLLTAMLRAIDLRREEVYIANVIKCRPPRNRNPHLEEMQQCTPYLHRQIELVRPKLLIALGAVAARHLLQTQVSIGKLRGQVHRYQNIPLVVTYHPAYLLRSPAEKRRTWEDLQMIRGYPQIHTDEHR